MLALAHFRRVSWASWVHHWFLSQAQFKYLCWARMVSIVPPRPPICHDTGGLSKMVSDTIYINRIFISSQFGGGLKAILHPTSIHDCPI